MCVDRLKGLMNRKKIQDLRVMERTQKIEYNGVHIVPAYAIVYMYV